MLRYLRLFLMLLLVGLIGMSGFRTEAQENQTSQDNFLYVTAVDWNHNGSKIAAVGIQQEGKQGYLRVIDSQTGQITYHLDPRPGGFTSVKWSPDDRFIAIGSYDQTIWVIDVKTQKQVAVLYGHQSTVNAISWNEDSTRLVSAGNWDGLVILWDMIAYKQIDNVKVGDVWSVKYSPDYLRIAVGGLGLRIYPSNLNLSQPDIKPSFDTLSVTALTWNHDGSRIAFGTQTFPDVTNPTKEKFGQLYIVDSKSGKVIKNIYTNDTTIYGIDWSADDSLIATHSSDGFIKIWSASSLNLLQTFNGTTRYPLHISFSPYGGRLVYGGVLQGDLTALNIVPQTKADDVTSLASGAVQIVVPAPSLEKLKSITQACGLQAKVQEALISQINANELDTFKSYISALANTDIPADMPEGCKADLLAVADALLAK